MSITAAEIKWAQSLQQKKYRAEYELFVVEGAKAMEELAASGWPVQTYWVTEAYLNQNPAAKRWDPAPIVVNENTLERASGLQANKTGLAIVPFKQWPRFSREADEWVIALDQVRDPGNLGTIIRIADWYGINKVLLSPDCVELYNPKVIQASMGSFLRVAVYEKGLGAVFAEDPDAPVIGAYLEGENLHAAKLPKAGYLLMGSESHGVSDSLARFVRQKVFIPRFGAAESLNVGIATALIADAIRRA